MSSRIKGLNLHIRIPLIVFLTTLGFLFPLSFLLAAFIGWTVFSDIKNAPEYEAQRIQAEKSANTPLSVIRVRERCESPAEVAFLNAMVEAFDLKTGPGCIEGQGLRLRNQVGMGQFRIHTSSTSWQYRADFLIDEKIVVEIDGATYHSSPEAIERDKCRDIDLKREGYLVIRIPAQVVFNSPKEAVQRVQNIRS